MSPIEHRWGPHERRVGKRGDSILISLRSYEPHRASLGASRAARMRREGVEDTVHTFPRGVGPLPSPCGESHQGHRV